MTYSKLFKAIIALLIVVMVAACAIICYAQFSSTVISNDMPNIETTPAKAVLPENLKTAATNSFMTSKEALTASSQTNIANAALSQQNTSAFPDPESYPLYDFEGNLTAYCVLFDDGYSIINSTTVTVYESALTEHPYANICADRYIYISPLNYAYLSGENYYFIGNDHSILNEQAIETLQSAWETLEANDVAALVEDNEAQVNQVAFADPDMSNIHLLYNDVPHILHATYFMYLSGSNAIGSNEFGKMEDGDWVFPDNNGESCAYVAMTMILQYYERTGLCDMIPSSFDSYLTATSRRFSKTQAIHDALWKMGGESFAMTDKIVSVFNDYFETYGYGAHASYNALYSGMKGSIDNHRPAIGEIGYYKGFIWNTGDGSFTSEYISNHQVVVYAYTTKSSGILQNFVCHTGWSNYDPLVINKAAFFANTEITVPGV